MKMTTLCDVPPFGESGFLNGPAGTKWPCLRLGPHVCILPLYRKRRIFRGPEIYVGLLQEYKEIIDNTRLKIPSDFLRDRPHNMETAMEILAAKTGITYGNILCFARLDQKLIPGWPPNVVLNNTKIWLVWAKKPTGKNVVWLSMKELWKMLRLLETPFIDAPTDHMLRWIEAIVHHKETLPQEPWS
ncbi:MAG: hypothetical protein WC309_03450 [Candidatus Paceibacterota bacterium]|jgi:hypothetical protein